MPNTTSATWPTLSAGQVARASDVEAKFDWSEFHIWPHSLGNATDNTYDLGNTVTASWRCLYSYSINATSTARGLAIGTTTVANNSSTALENSGTTAILLPRLSTTQRDALTAADGMVVYNTTTSTMQKRENGAWANMGGTDYGMVASVRVVTSSAVNQDMINLTAVAGKISGMVFGATTTSQPEVTLTLDGTAYTASGTAASVFEYLIFDYRDTTTLFHLGLNTTTLSPIPAEGLIEANFRTSARVQVRAAGSAQNTFRLFYARSA